MVTPLGVYISVPFCKAKCTFCNFASGAFGADRMQPYVDRVCDEIGAARVAPAKSGAQLPELMDTIYFGGGTPSLLSAAQFRQMFQGLRDAFELARDAEITLECAPGQLADETLDELLRLGMNRVSFGVQSFVDRETTAVGRLHTRLECDAEIERIHNAGIKDISIDLIAGLPYQTRESWQYSLEHAIASKIQHVSVYMLEVDEESRLGEEVLTKGTRYHASAVPSEDESAEWYQMACEQLDAAGLGQYEISNFALQGYASRHNLKYWQRLPYVGFGLDAHSMLLTDIGAVRFANTSDMDAYIDRPESAFRQVSQRVAEPDFDVINLERAFEEALFLGLRLNEGVDLRLLRGQFGEAMVQDALPALFEVREAGLLEMESDRIRLTARGRMISNEVFSRLLVPSAA